jgi:hypothetical protein
VPGMKSLMLHDMYLPGSNSRRHRRRRHKSQQGILAADPTDRRAVPAPYSRLGAFCDSHREARKAMGTHSSTALASRLRGMPWARSLRGDLEERGDIQPWG